MLPVRLRFRPRYLLRLRSVVAILLLFCLTFLVFIPNWCRRHPRWCNPRLYDRLKVRLPSSNSLDDESIVRARNALEFLSKRKDHRKPYHAASSKSTLTIAITAKRRPYPVRSGKPKNLRYLTQVAAELLKTADYVHERRGADFHVSLFLCNIDNEPEKFEEAVELARFIEMITVDPGWSAEEQEGDTMEDRKDQKREDRILNHEKRDYAFCLGNALEKTDENGFVLVFEDDALPRDGFGGMLESVIDRLERRRPGEFRDPVLVKLFHPENHRKIPWIIQALVCSILLATPWIYLRKYRNFVIQIAYSFCLFWCFGQLTFATVRFRITNNVYLTPHESCCTPAVLYTHGAADRLLQYLYEHRARAGYALDHIMDEAPGIEKLMTDLNLVRHIGRYSTLRSAPVKSDFW